MSDELVDIVRSIVEQRGDADDTLRSVVEALAGNAEVRWAGISFTEDGALVPGPTQGLPDDARRQSVAISFAGALVGELRVDGAVARDELERIATLIAPLVLIGWDTGGATWDP